MKKIVLIGLVILVVLFGIMYGLDAIGIIDIDKMMAEEAERKAAEDEKKAAKAEEKARKKQEEIEAKQKTLDELFEKENLGYDLAFREEPVSGRVEYYLVDVDESKITYVYCHYYRGSGELAEKTIKTTTGDYKKKTKDLKEVDVTIFVDKLKKVIADDSVEEKYKELFPKSK